MIKNIIELNEFDISKIDAGLDLKSGLLDDMDTEQTVGFISVSWIRTLLKQGTLNAEDALSIYINFCDNINNPDFINETRELYNKLIIK